MPSSRGLVAPTHLLYADDVLLFCNASIVKLLENIFSHYVSFSVQLVNSHNLFIYFGKWNSSLLRLAIVDNLSMKQGSLSSFYLGVPLFCKSPKKIYLWSIVDKILAKFST